jgi:hypothetical protein
VMIFAHDDDYNVRGADDPSARPDGGPPS